MYKNILKSCKKPNRQHPSHKPLPIHPDFPTEKPKSKIDKRGPNTHPKQPPIRDDAHGQKI